MCSTSLTETIEYYVSRKTQVYVLLIDASKAFDRVSHIKLFNSLQAHGVCPLIIWVLYNMYTNSDIPLYGIHIFVSDRLHLQWNCCK